MEKPTLLETLILPPDHPLRRQPEPTESRVDYTNFTDHQAFEAAYPGATCGLGERSVATLVQVGVQTEPLEQEAA